MMADRLSVLHLNGVKAMTFKPGQACFNAILNEDDVRKIRSNYSNGMTVKQICEYTGMSENAIRCIVKYKTWKYVK